MIVLFKGKEDCCGCAACESICRQNAISMVPDEEGFLYPDIDYAKCVSCGKCMNVCPFKFEPKIEGRLDNLEVYAVKHSDNDIRMNSASGGAYTAISDCILGQDNNKAAIYGAAFDNDFNVSHIKASTKKERNRFLGSKYVQSDLREVYKSIKSDLQSGKITVLLTGTPCQTAGLSNYLKNTNTNNLVLNDIICHGVPSPALWRDYVHFLEKKNKHKLTEYSFRFKKIGWRGYNVCAVFANGKQSINTADVVTYTKIFSQDISLRPSCYNCKFTNKTRPSDITIGDYWGIDRINSEFDDNTGVSLVLINTYKGKKLFEAAKSRLIVKNSNIVDCEQHNLKSPTELPDFRQQFWSDYIKKGYKYISKKYAQYTFKIRLKKLIKKIINRRKWG